MSLEYGQIFKDKEPRWLRCPACGGSGKKPASDPMLWTLLLSHIDISKQDRALIAQGICLACKGKGQILIGNNSGWIKRVLRKIF